MANLLHSTFIRPLGFYFIFRVHYLMSYSLMNSCLNINQTITLLSLNPVCVISQNVRRSQYNAVLRVVHLTKHSHNASIVFSFGVIAFSTRPTPEESNNNTTRTIHSL